MQARRELVSREAHETTIDDMAGLVLTKLSGWHAHCGRRRAEAMLRALRTDIAEACTKLADEQDEPPRLTNGSPCAPVANLARMVGKQRCRTILHLREMDPNSSR